MEAKKTILILLTIFILGPLVFVGSCFPIGLWGFSLAWSNKLGGIVFISAWILGGLLAIFICDRVIKRITKK